MTTPLQQTLDGLASTEKQQERLAAYLKEHGERFWITSMGKLANLPVPKKLIQKLTPGQILIFPSNPLKPGFLILP